MRHTFKRKLESGFPSQFPKNMAFAVPFTINFNHTSLWPAVSISYNFIISPPLPPTATGDDCSLFGSDLPSSIKDNFESGSMSPESWQLIQGGGVGSGCGQLSPHAHGDSLYFNGCKMRQAVTKPLDLTRARYRYWQSILCMNQRCKCRLTCLTATIGIESSTFNLFFLKPSVFFLPSLSLYSKIMFVLQIGSLAQTDSCNIALDQPDTVDRAVLLQYSVNNGVSWHVIAQHQPKDFIKAQRVSYNIPL